MKIEDLRIGNFIDVSESDKPYYAEVVMLNHAGKDYISYDNALFEEVSQAWAIMESLIGEIKPIPITEKWLLKFGFTKPNNWHCLLLYISSDNYEHMRSSLQIAHVGCGNVQVCRAGINAYSAKVEYVHQLQNLFFALTSEELTIKP